MKRDTYLCAVEALFRSRPRQRISCYELAAVGGANGWRTRVSNCRCQLKMKITDRPKVETLPSGAKVTYYVYTPPSEPQQSSLFREQESAA